MIILLFSIWFLSVLCRAALEASSFKDFRSWFPELLCTILKHQKFYYTRRIVICVLFVSGMMIGIA